MIEFCGRYADRCAMFFDGGISTIHTPRRFFSGNSFYTTSANRMSRHVFADAVTAEDLAYLLDTELKRREEVGEAEGDDGESSNGAGGGIGSNVGSGGGTDIGSTGMPENRGTTGMRWPDRRIRMQTRRPR